MPANFPSAAASVTGGTSTKAMIPPPTKRSTTQPKLSPASYVGSSAGHTRAENHPTADCAFRPFGAHGLVRLHKVYSEGER